MWPLTTINTFKKYEREGLKHSQNDDGGQMEVVFTIAEINYVVVSLFCDLVQSLLFIYAMLSSVAALFALFLA